MHSVVHTAYVLRNIHDHSNPGTNCLTWNLLRISFYNVYSKTSARHGIQPTHSGENINFALRGDNSLYS